MAGRLSAKQRTPKRWPGSHAKSRESSASRTLAPLIVTLALIGVFLAAVGLGQIPAIPGMVDLLSSWGAPAGTGAGLGRSVPTRISIPSLGVRANTVEVGKAADGSIAPPTSDPVKDAGWYQLGPTPGEMGTAVIVGHVDTANKPAVFGKLGALGQGKLIEVRRQDRRTATFTVNSVERFPKTSFPADRVFEAAARKPRLVLITCGGAWVGGELGYADNVIVFATLS
jgi:Sortase domain